MLGREVKTLINQTQAATIVWIDNVNFFLSISSSGTGDAGYRSVIWNATNDYGKPVSASIYLYQIQAGEYISTKKIVLLK